MQSGTPMTTAGDTALVETLTGAVFPPVGVGVVVFDVVGTLVEPSPSVAEAYQRAATRHGVQSDTSEIQQTHFDSVWSLKMCLFFGCMQARLEPRLGNMAVNDSPLKDGLSKARECPAGLQFG